MDLSFLYQSGAQVAQVALSAVLMYAAVVVVLRLSGKRTLTSMNAFDFVVTVALGTTLASTVLSDSVSLAEGLTALIVLVALQALVATLSAHFAGVRRAVKAEPTLVVHNGHILEEAMRDARLSKAEVLAAIRGEGEADLADVHAVILETNGKLSVVTGAPDRRGKAMDAARTPGV